MHSDSKKRRSFLALLFAAGDLRRYAKRYAKKYNIHFPWARPAFSLSSNNFMDTIK